MNKLFKFFNKKKTSVEPSRTGLRIAKSTYPEFPEGMSETEKFNYTWQSIAKRSTEIYERLQKPSMK